MKKSYLVQWTENHVYKYCTWVEAGSAKEAKQLANSNEFDDGRYAEFDHVKSVGRKTATLEEDLPAKEGVKVASYDELLEHLNYGREEEYE